jgi:Domain of unknown function (DUF4148)
MKLAQSLIVAAVLVLPAVSSFAQSNQPLTRAEVKAQLVQVEKEGYNPSILADTTYPANIQAVDAKISAENGAAVTAYGTVAEGTSTSSASTRNAASSNN